MIIKTLIAIVSVAGLAACSWPPSWPSLPSMPSMPSLPSFPSLTSDKEDPGNQPPVDCQAASRMDLKSLDWLGAKFIDIRIRNERFTPGILVLQKNKPAVIRVFNADKAMRTFNAKEFFRAAVIFEIFYDGRKVPETCIDAIRIGAGKWTEIKIVPLRQGDYFYGERDSSTRTVTPFYTRSKTGQIIVR